jgi:hypothetical protein
MNLIRSKAWYEKKAMLEGNCSIAAGHFPSEILEATRTSVAAAKKASSIKRLSASKPAKRRKSS